MVICVAEVLALLCRVTLPRLLGMASTAAEQVVAAPFTSRPADSHSSCGVLVQAVNHATGQNTWRVMAADYDYNQEVARAAFADMLHDSERNALYRAGLQAAIRAKRQAGEEVDTTAPS